MNGNNMDQQMCRTCLAETDGSIFKTIILAQKELSLVEMLNECTELKVTKFDGISLNICDICTEEIIRSYEFRKKCWESHNFLVRRLNEYRIDSDLIKHEALSPILDERRIDSDIIKYEVQSPIEAVDDVADLLLGLEDEDTEAVPTNNQTPDRGAVKCKLCDKFYFRRKLMFHHLRTEHDILEYDKYECQYCKKSFNHFSNLKRHIISIHEPDEVKFICHHCGEKLKNRTNLMLHMRRHTGERPFKCDFCEYSATQQATFTNHMRTHTDERPYECDICGKLFRTSSSRASHRKGHSTETPYECIVCSKKFKHNKIYKEHMVIHNPDKYIECKYCGKKFARKKNLAVHLKQHTGEKPHVCEICGKGFIQKHCWQTHMKNNH